jgi:hypothetical protein
MKYAILAALLFVPLAVAGSYLSRDPTSTEAPKIQLRTVQLPTAEPVANKAQPKRKPKVRKQQTRRATVDRVRVHRTTAPTRGGGTDGDDDDRAARSSRGAAPVPIPAPARAGARGDDETADQGGGADDDSAGGGAEGSGNDGDD